MNNFHLKLFTDELQLAAERVIKKEPRLYNIIINTPPKSLKSAIVSVAFMPWVWAKAPWLRFITCSYSPELASRDCKNSRQLITSEWYQQLFGNVYQLTNDAEGYIENDKGGERRTTSPKSSKTGHKSDIILIDDANQADDRYSSAERNIVNRWFSETLVTRLDNPDVGLICEIQQRIDGEDLTGYLIKNQASKWAMISLPADLSKGHKPVPVVLTKFYKNGLMSPIRLSKKTLEDAELNLGTAYSGQYLQDPQVIGGRFFKESWPRYYKPQQMPAFESIIISGDTAFTGKHCNTSLQLWGYKAPDAYLLKDQTELMNNEQTEACLIRLYESCPGCTMVIEQASSGFTILQNLSKKYRVFSFIPQKFGGKEVRATSTASMWWQGHVWLPDEPYYRTTYMEEFLNFPAGAKDRVDSASQALIYFSVLLPGKSQLLHLSHDNIVSDNYVLMGQPNKG